MMKHFMKMAAIALVCASCSNDLPEMVTGSQSDIPKTNLEYALEYAEDLIGQIDPQTRGVSREANVQFVCSPATRSGRQDTLLYLVNYADNMGFALLDAEGKNGGVYAISPKGKLEFSDSVNNPTLAHFFCQVELASTTPIIPDQDSLKVIGWNGGNPIVVTDEANPLLCNRYAGWTSDYIPGAGANGKIGPVTTAATALAKMLAYYLHPNTINGTAINWNYISGSSVSQTAVNQLLRTLNTQSFLGDNPIAGSTVTGDSGRSVTPQNIRDALAKLGFGFAPLDYDDENDLFANFSYAKDMKIILGSKQIISGTRPPKGPVIAFTQPLDNNTNSLYPYYQYWLIDGFIDRTKTSPGFIPPAGYVTNMPTLYHCIWGLDDYLDGYYAFVVEGYIDNNVAYYVTSKDPVTGQYKKELVFEEMEYQYLFPNPGAIGGFDLQPLDQP